MSETSQPPPASPDESPHQPAAQSAAKSPASPGRNEVRLIGRVAASAEERELPSGDVIMTARLIIDRDAAALSRSNQRVDTLDCVAWTVRVQRSMRNWKPGDLVEVEGAIRRRFFRGPSGPASRAEVEITAARRLRT